MQDRDWKKYLGDLRGKKRVIADLAAQHAGMIPSQTFTMYWFSDTDEGEDNFKERVKKILGKKLFEEITKEEGENS